MNKEFDFDKLGGLLPAVVQDSRDREVLMVGFMNREALERTLESGYRLRVVSACTDCDRDTLLVRVEVEGAGVVCHRGTRSCFTEAVLQQRIVAVGKEAR
jgi:phosphoribosyl-ATP pyrophosphohydrolase/phosphoribosyl-AMP cyclohydrolase